MVFGPTSLVEREDDDIRSRSEAAAIDVGIQLSLCVLDSVTGDRHACFKFAFELVVRLGEPEFKLFFGAPLYDEMNGENVDWIWITDNGPFEIPESQFAL